jgi:hypothetical protein
MHAQLFLVPLLLCAAPAAAQPAPQLPPELSDPATAQRLAVAVQALSGALLDVRVGEMKAALEGRQPSAAERRETVRDIARRDDPDFDGHLQQRLSAIGPTMQQSMRALNQALPAMMDGLAQARKSLERAVANMPDPTYPKR